MRSGILTLLLVAIGCAAFAQQSTTTPKKNVDNIYTIKELFLEKYLQTNTEKEEETGDDNDLARFNRWYNLMLPRTYPTGKLPAPSALLDAYKSNSNQYINAEERTTSGRIWQSLGPNNVPTNYNGIGRINCIVIDPNDTNTLYIGSAGGGVWISHDGGTTWASNSDNFPALSIADIAVNPINSDTIYAATGDGYGYIGGSYSIFWGGVYSAGVMKSTDNGHTWATTGLSYLQSQNDIIQRLLLHPRRTNVLLAATTNGVVRSADGGATWDTTTTGHIFSMAFYPGQPDTVYAVNQSDLIVSYDAGVTWTTIYFGINTTGDRCTIAVSPSSPNSVWILNDADILYRSYDGGHHFYATSTSPSASASFYGYYDRVLAVSPTDSNYIVACGEFMSKSADGGTSWAHLDGTRHVHVDNHALTINPLQTNTIYSGNDGGIFVTHDGGASWTTLGSGLTISQIYRISSSRQNPAIMLGGLQDNGSFYNNGSTWVQSNAPSGDGMDNAIHPIDDRVQITSYQYGNFFISHDRGSTYTGVGLPSSIVGSGAWTTPVVFNPNNADTIYFGFNNIYASYDGGVSAASTSSSSAELFPSGAICVAVAPSNAKYIYASDFDRILRSENGGATWVNVSGSLPSGQAKTGIAIDYRNPLIVYLTVSGYANGAKVYQSTIGGNTWVNISPGIPNVPANCIAVDSSAAGGLFVGTDAGVFYRDDTTVNFIPYYTGLPNVIVDDIDINYKNYTVIAATYGRGAWACKLKNNPPPPTAVATLEGLGGIGLYPNPTRSSWKVTFRQQMPPAYSVEVLDVNGKTVLSQENKDVIEAGRLANGVYSVRITTGGESTVLKAVKE